jgi:hypothetical protein
MSASGFSSSGLERMYRVMAAHVERGAVPGLVTLLSRGDEVRVDALSTLAVGGRANAAGHHLPHHGFGTAWSSDPVEDLVAILMTQRALFRQASDVYLDFWTSAYQPSTEPARGVDSGRPRSTLG